MRDTKTDKQYNAPAQVNVSHEQLLCS